MGEGYLHRVEVRYAGTVDTIQGVLTAEQPVRVAPSRILGFVYEDDEIVAAFEYDAHTRRLRRHRLPSDFHPFSSSPAFAPDGAHIAYVVTPGDATGWAVARTWPKRGLVWRSARVEIPATDAPGGSLVRWLSPDTAEVLIETGFSTDSMWYRVLGSIRRKAVISADSIPQPKLQH